MSFSIENYLAVQIPSDWTHRRLKEVSDVAPSNVDKHEVEGQPKVLLCNYVDTYKNERITSTIEFMPATATHVQIDRLSLKSGDITITKDSESPWDIGVPALISENIPNLVCGYHLSKISPLEGVMTGQYLVWALRSKPVNLQFALAAQGITRFGLNSSSLADGVVPCPPLEKQLAIANYLNTETKRIDGLIEEKLKLKELLIELRVATISDAVANGLDSNVRKKNSGVAWLGDIPEHWECKPLRYLVKVKTGWTPSAEAFVDDECEGCIPWYAPADLQNYFLAEASKIISPNYASEVDIFDVGTVVLVGIGDVGRVSQMTRWGTGNQQLNFLTPLGDIDSDFLEYALLAARSYVLSRANVNLIPILNQEGTKKLVVPVPEMDEQISIVSYLNAETKRIDELVSHVNSEIELLKELRASTITDAVLGRIDVRQAATH